MAEWAEWFEQNSTTFANSKTVSTKERRALSRRLLADPTLPRCPRAPPAADADVVAEPTHVQRLLRGRSGWHIVRLSTRMLVLFFWQRGHTTWVLDITGCGTLRHRAVCILFDAHMSAAMQPLADFLGDDDGPATVFEVAIEAACSALSIDISFVDRQQILSELRPPAKRARQRTRPGDSDASSGSSEASSAAELPGHRSEDSAATPEVETDLESVVDEGDQLSSGSDTGGVHGGSSIAPQVHDDAGEGSADAPQEEGLRHARDTWTVFRNMWWRVASHPAYGDVRITLVPGMLNSGIGTGAQKQMTPRQFGEATPNVPCTVFLLRCWSVWRARQGAWLDDGRYPYRRRELALQVQQLRAELVQFQAALAPGSPFCGSMVAERLARGWAPEIVAAVTGRP